jgi:hypothetical protein
MDLTSLYLLDKLEANSLLVEFGLGTDGELRPEGMEQILSELRDENLMLCESKITKNDNEVKKFKDIFDKVKHIRAGHTNVMTLETLNANSDIETEYRFRSQIGKKIWQTSYDLILESKYFGRVYTINGKALAKRRKQTAFSYRNPLEQYIKLKRISLDWKTEMDLFYLWSGNNWTTPNKEGNSLFLLLKGSMEGEIKNCLIESTEYAKSIMQNSNARRAAFPHLAF